MPAELTSVCVFCGSNRGLDPLFGQAAADVGRLLAAEGITLVYGGGRVGLMGAVADAALAAGGQVVGVIPRSITELEPAHAGLTELHLVESMHERKALMASLSDAFMVLPGGLGTLEEAFETVSWTQLGLQDKPTGFLNVAGFYTPLMAQLDQMVQAAFVREEHRRAVPVSDHPGQLLELLRNFDPPRVHKLIGREAS
jgi:uncharacterized protein (TIGR00730 family)